MGMHCCFARTLRMRIASRLGSGVGSVSGACASAEPRAYRLGGGVQQAASTPFRARLRAKRSPGFTLIELLVVLSILGLLAGLLLSGVQAAREASRRVQCSSRIRQQAIATHNFHAAYGRFPAGRDARDGLDHSWCTAILPFLEQDNVAGQIDLDQHWDAPGQNHNASRAVLPVFRCPTSLLDFPGDTDYGGMQGSILSGINWRFQKGGMFGSGIMIHVSKKSERPVSIAEVLDGTSQTICIAEVVDRLDHEHGMWADGFNAFSHDNGPINVHNGGEIFSFHPGGAYVGLADGSVHFLSETVSRYVLGSLCTRAGGETFDATAW